MAVDKSSSQETMPATGCHIGAYAGYIRQVVVDRKACKIGANMYVISFSNPGLHGVLDRKQHDLGTVKVEIIHEVEA